MSYEKQGFADGQVLKAEHLVKMEEAILNTSWNDLKDRPFGNGFLIEMIPETTITGTSSGCNYIYTFNPNIDEFVVGDTYIVKYNGVEYECVAKQSSRIGNNIAYALNEFDPNTEFDPSNENTYPFYISTYNAVVFGTGEHTLSMHHVGLKTIDDEFIPDTVQRTIPWVSIETDRYGIIEGCSHTAEQIYDLHKQYHMVLANCNQQVFTLAEANFGDGYFWCTFISYYNEELLVVKINDQDDTVTYTRIPIPDNTNIINNGSGIKLKGAATGSLGTSSVAIGADCEASGEYAYAEGRFTNAIGDYTHAEGKGTTAATDSQHVQGSYNVEDTDSRYLHIIGNGTDDTHRYNAHTVDKDGNAWYAGDVYVGGSSQDDANKLATEGLVYAMLNEARIIDSSTKGSSKKFRITVDDEGNISAEEVKEE